MRYLILIFLIKTVRPVVFFTDTSPTTDSCVNLCKDADLPSLELEYFEQVACQTGCNNFNIIQFTDELNINTTKKECHLSCQESYIVVKESEICITGCNLMAKKRVGEKSTLIVSEEESIVLAEPFETEFMSDPVVRSQLEVGFNIDYKIPETHIRTMPIEFNAESIKKVESKSDWLDCASRSSGVPRWILLSAILSAVLIALWLSFSSEKKAVQDDILLGVDVPYGKLDSDDEIIVKDCDILEKNPIVLEHDINFSTPPKYCVESEKV